MKITLTGTEFNRIMRICIPALSKEGIREALEYIEIQCNGQGEGCATACDGYTLMQTRFSCRGDKGTYMIRPTKTVRNDCTIEITKEDGKISISDSMETITRPDYGGPYISHANICRKAQKGKPRITVAFSAKLLERMLKSFAAGRQIVYLEMRDPEKVVVVKSSYGACGLVVPMRTGEDYEEPEFWHMEDEKQ